MPVIGFLGARSPRTLQVSWSVPQGSHQAGYVEGQNVQIEYRFAEGRYERLAGLAEELVRRQVVVIAAIGGTPAALAAKAATTTIPIVFANGTDPIASRPGNEPRTDQGGNIGRDLLASETVPKRLEVLHELIPRSTGRRNLVNPVIPITKARSKTPRRRAHSRGLQLLSRAPAPRTRSTRGSKPLCSGASMR